MKPAKNFSRISNPAHINIAGKRTARGTEESRSDAHLEFHSEILGAEGNLFTLFAK